MRQIKLDPRKAKQAGDKGLQTAIDHTNSVSKEWSIEAWKVFKRWLSRKPPGYRFQIENFRLHIQIYGGLPSPESDRSYGFLARRARDQKLIKSLGARPTKSISAHGCFSIEWQKL